MSWRTEDELLVEMDTWQPLPDEIDPRWDALSPDGDQLWADAERVLAAADASGDHGWLRVAVRVFEYVPDWDLHGGVLNLRHGPERAFLAVPDGDQRFAHQLEGLTQHPRAGTRLWAVHELGVLRQLSSLHCLVSRLEDGHPAVASAALQSLRMLAQDHREAAAVHARMQQRG